MTPDLAELRRLYEEAMRVDSNEMAWDGWTVAISEAAEDLFDAAAERDALAAKVERVRALHRPARNDTARSPICPDCDGKAGVHPCGCWADTDYEPVCAVCNEGHKGMSVPWPCPTIRALGGAEAGGARCPKLGRR